MQLPCQGLKPREGLYFFPAKELQNDTISRDWNDNFESERDCILASLASVGYRGESFFDGEETRGFQFSFEPEDAAPGLSGRREHHGSVI
jgi:hypothetical protein